MEILPAILGRSLHEITEQTNMVDHASKILHLDVMDGHFVPELTPLDINAMVDETYLYDLHLMVSDPGDVLERFNEYDIRYVFAHVEIEPELLQHFFEIAQEKNLKIGLALKPNTPITVLDQYLDLVQAVLFLTVVPGDSGRPFQTEVIQKVRDLRQQHPTIFIELDGGVSINTLHLVGPVDSCAAHSAVFNANTHFKDAYQQLVQQANHKEPA